MNLSATQMIEEEDAKPHKPEKDPNINIPLRQRRLPASFWQEPCIAPSQTNRDASHSTISPVVQQYPLANLHPWTANSNSVLPMVLPQRFLPPNHFLMSQNSVAPWVRGATSNCCSCATCLSYSYVIPRMPEGYGSFRYRPPMSLPYCPGINCVDQSCKLCFASSSDHWHPDRMRHFRLRAARYNAILD